MEIVMYLNLLKRLIKNIVKENLDGVEELIDVDADIEYQDNIEYLIKKAKENPKISVKWNAWVDKKIKKILNEDGEEMLKRVFKHSYSYGQKYRNRFT